MQAVMRELEERGFILGQSMWVDGAQHFTGNLRLLLDPYLYQARAVMLNGFYRYFSF